MSNPWSTDVPIQFWRHTFLFSEKLLLELCGELLNCLFFPSRDRSKLPKMVSIISYWFSRLCFSTTTSLISSIKGYQQLLTWGRLLNRKMMNIELRVSKFSFLHNCWLHLFHQGLSKSLPVETFRFLQKQQSYYDRPKISETSTIFFVDMQTHNFPTFFCDIPLFAQV